MVGTKFFYPYSFCAVNLYEIYDFSKYLEFGYNFMDTMCEEMDTTTPFFVCQKLRKNYKKIDLVPCGVRSKLKEALLKAFSVKLRKSSISFRH